ncbi:hypothetical protein [Aquaticitalea lipolytica]|nr:hypothetical protein [Aquaticitalea lipolytica]
MNFIKVVIFIFCLSYACDMPAQNVYVTKTGTKYHKETCHFLKNSKKEITYEKAIERGFDACSVCKPRKEVSDSQSISSENSLTTTNRNTTSTQCLGKTKSGARCKRMAKSTSGKCYQH